MAGIPSGLPITNCRATRAGPALFPGDPPDVGLCCADRPTAEISTGVPRLMGGLYGIGINSDQTSVSDDTTSVSGSPLYAHFAGRIALIGATPEIAITGLTVGHTYDFYIALLTYGAPATLGYRLYSGVGATGVKYVDQTGFIVPEGYVGDAVGFSHVSPAAFWVDCGKVSFMAASTSLFIRCATDGSAAQVAMFGLKDTAGGSVPSTIDDLTCMFVG